MQLDIVRSSFGGELIKLECSWGSNVYQQILSNESLWPTPMYKISRHNGIECMGMFVGGRIDTLGWACCVWSSLGDLRRVLLCLYIATCSIIKKFSLLSCEFKRDTEVRQFGMGEVMKAMPRWSSSKYFSCWGYFVFHYSLKLPPSSVAKHIDVSDGELSSKVD